MKTKLLALLAAVAGLVPLAPAQTMVEYSTLATHSAKTALAAPSLAPHITRKGADPYGTTKGQVWQEKNARLKDENPSKPAPPAVFILNSGERLETADYFITAESLHVSQQDKARTIPMSAVNLNATLAANHQRGIDLKIPENKAQITLGF